MAGAIVIDDGKNAPVAAAPPDLSGERNISANIHDHHKDPHICKHGKLITLKENNFVYPDLNIVPTVEAY